MPKIGRILLLSIIILVFVPGCSILNFDKSDQATLDSLRDAGSDLSIIHPFDFYIYHNNETGAHNICAELEQDGFQVSVQEGAIEGEWLCLAKLNFIPSIEKLSELQVVFEDLIAKFGGEYDGWETIVITE